MKINKVLSIIFMGVFAIGLTMGFTGCVGPSNEDSCYVETTTVHNIEFTPTGIGEKRHEKNEAGYLKIRFNVFNGNSSGVYTFDPLGFYAVIDEVESGRSALGAEFSFSTVSAGESRNVVVIFKLNYNEDKLTKIEIKYLDVLLYRWVG